MDEVKYELEVKMDYTKRGENAPEVECNNRTIAERIYTH